MSKDTDRGTVGERDWPTGHPAASDYRGESYTPPDPPFAVDWPKGHPCRDGANVEKNWRHEPTAPEPTEQGE